MNSTVETMSSIVKCAEETIANSVYVATSIFGWLRDRINHVYTHVSDVSASIFVNVPLDPEIVNPYTLLAYRCLLVLLVNMLSISIDVIGQLRTGNAKSVDIVLSDLSWNEVEIKSQLLFGILLFLHNVQTEEVFFSTYGIMGVVLQTIPGYFFHVLALLGMCWGVILGKGAWQPTL